VGHRRVQPALGPISRTLPQGGERFIGIGLGYAAATAGPRVDRTLVLFRPLPRLKPICLRTGANCVADKIRRRRALEAPGPGAYCPFFFFLSLGPNRQLPRALVQGRLRELGAVGRGGVPHGGQFGFDSGGWKKRPGCCESGSRYSLPGEDGAEREIRLTQGAADHQKGAKAVTVPFNLFR